VFERLRESSGLKPIATSLPVEEEHSSECDDLLERLVTLESLLAEDLARKPKHQKPQLQEQWRKEIEMLEAQL
jgi:hypothetical protein